MSSLATCILAGVVLAAPADKPPPREYLPPTVSWLRQFEAVQMLTAILSGTPPASGDMGWFHPGQGRYDLRWLAARMDKDHDGAVARDEFVGPPKWFDRLDRNHDGRLTAADFDWSDTSPIVREMRIVNALFSRADANHNEKISAAEWQALFEQTARGKDSLSREELHAMLFPPPAPRPRSQSSAAMPTPWTLLKGLFEGEIGSWHEGPAVGRHAPNFTLRTFDRESTFSLSRFRGKKPVVLIFGSFT